MTTSNPTTWVDLPLSDEPLDSAVMFTNAKKGSDLSLRLRSGRKLAVTVRTLRTVIDGQVAFDMSAIDDYCLRIQYRAENLNLRGLRVRQDSYGYAEDLRSDVESWAAGMTDELSWVCDAEVRLGNGQPAAAAQAGTS